MSVDREPSDVDDSDGRPARPTGLDREVDPSIDPTSETEPPPGHGPARDDAVDPRSEVEPATTAPGTTDQPPAGGASLAGHPAEPVDHRFGLEATDTDVGSAETSQQSETRALISSGETDSRTLARAAVEEVASHPGTAAEKSAHFEQLSAEITDVSAAEWSASRLAGADGSSVFMGKLGEMLVVSPRGDVYRGSLGSGGGGDVTLSEAGHLAMHVNYDKLKQVNEDR